MERAGTGMPIMTDWATTRRNEGRQLCMAVVKKGERRSEVRFTSAVKDFLISPKKTLGKGNDG